MCTGTKLPNFNVLSLRVTKTNILEDVFKYLMNQLILIKVV
mgnify:FL=1|jgi:hypothetical protein